MNKMSPIPVAKIAVHIRAAKIPVTWSIREHPIPEARDCDGRVITTAGVERVFWPQVEAAKHGEVEMVEIEDALECRAQVLKALRTDKTENAALRVLNKVGAWRLENGNPAVDMWAKGTFANFSYRHRWVTSARVLPMQLNELLRDADRWYDLLRTRNPKRIQEALAGPLPASSRPADISSFAMEASFGNTLPISLEWVGRDPFAVIETVCAAELMVAAAWSDVASGSGPQLCAECGTRFTHPRKKKHCTYDCAHKSAQREYKRRLADKQGSRPDKKAT